MKKKLFNLFLIFILISSFLFFIPSVNSAPGEENYSDGVYTTGFEDGVALSQYDTQYFNSTDYGAYQFYVSSEEKYAGSLGFAIKSDGGSDNIGSWAFNLDNYIYNFSAIIRFSVFSGSMRLKFYNIYSVLLYDILFAGNGGEVQCKYYDPTGSNTINNDIPNDAWIYFSILQYDNGVVRYGADYEYVDGNPQNSDLEYGIHRIDFTSTGSGSRSMWCDNVTIYTGSFEQESGCDFSGYQKIGNAVDISSSGTNEGVFKDTDYDIFTCGTTQYGNFYNVISTQYRIPLKAEIKGIEFVTSAGYLDIMERGEFLKLYCFIETSTGTKYNLGAYTNYIMINFNTVKLQWCGYSDVFLDNEYYTIYFYNPSNNVVCGGEHIQLFWITYQYYLNNPDKIPDGFFEIKEGQVLPLFPSYPTYKETVIGDLNYALYYIATDIAPGCEGFSDALNIDKTIYKIGDVPLYCSGTVADLSSSRTLHLFKNGTEIYVSGGITFPFIVSTCAFYLSFSPNAIGSYWIRLQTDTTVLDNKSFTVIAPDNQNYWIYSEPNPSYYASAYTVYYFFNNSDNFNGLLIASLTNNMANITDAIYKIDITENGYGNFTLDTGTVYDVLYWLLYVYNTNISKYVRVGNIHMHITRSYFSESYIRWERPVDGIREDNDIVTACLIGKHNYLGSNIVIKINNITRDSVTSETTFHKCYTFTKPGVYNASLVLIVGSINKVLDYSILTIADLREVTYPGDIFDIPEPFSYLIALIIIVVLTFTPLIISTTLASKTNITDIHIPGLVYVAMFCLGVIISVAPPMKLLDYWVLFFILFVLILAFAILWIQRKIAE